MIGHPELDGPAAPYPSQFGLTFLLQFQNWCEITGQEDGYYYEDWLY